MKRIFSLLLLLSSYSSFSQSAMPVVADLGVSSPYLTDLAGVPLGNHHEVGINQQVYLRVDIHNYQGNTTVPAKTCQFIIGLGDKMILDPGFNLATAPLSAYYKWTIGTGSGQVQLTGTLIAPLPANFSGTATFGIKAAASGSSTVSAQHANSNLDPVYNLSDPNASNNGVGMSYTVTRRSAVITDMTPRSLYVYPNPVTDLNYITIAAREGIFDGRYKLELYDNSGRLYQSRQVDVSNTKTIRYELTNKMGAGQYTIRVINTDGTQSAAVKFEKL